ncbi:hypothetical protein ABBQ38_003399 [Trebouxia sp. C0009 RCD-2024]
MSITAAKLTDGIRVDRATQKGSVYDVIRLVTKKKGGDTVQTFSRIQNRYNEFITKCVKLRINGKGRETPVADAATLVEVAWLCPGKAAVAFRRKGAESVCRMLGGDLTLVDEIQRRHTEVAGTAEEEFLLADAQDSPQPVTSHKRCLDDDDEVYAARKQQILGQISQQTIKEHAQGSMSILDMLSAGNAPPATMQLLQTIRHNVTARLGSMIETGIQGMLAIEAPQQQEQLSINQQAQRWTVQMYASRLGLPAAACTANKLKDVGAVASKIWCKERLLPSIEKQSDGTLARVQFQPSSNVAERDVFLPEQDPHLLAEARMKYSLAYKGGYEAADSSNYDVWTYPAQTGAEVLKEAFERVAARFRS